ncbi:MAG: 1-acyl-sn-glycerol-3-phosphate acyltransferase [Spirochaetales bacterium]|nr:1-acyl-sn-glycerol-3-phosphate acyltransferase [Spirochaetales bacterium]
MKKYIRIFLPIVIVVPVMTLSLILFPLYFILSKLKLKRLEADIYYIMVRLLAFLVMTLIGARMHVSGQEKLDFRNRCYCYIGNHQSMLDIVSLVWTRKLETGFIGKTEVRKIPLINAYFYEFGSVYLDRKSPKNSIRAILKGSEYLKNGHSMTIYPEGTRSKDGCIHEFKAGSFKMATRVGATIVPVVVKGTRALFENVQDLRRHDVYVRFLDPIETKDMSEEELKDLHTRVENAIREEYDRLPPLEAL